MKSIIFLKLAFSLLILLFISKPTYGQYIEELDPERPRGALTSGEIHIINRSNSNLNVRYSLNKSNWKNTSIRKDSDILASLDIKDANLFIELCNSQNMRILCDVYRLKPRKRYVIEYSDEHKKVILTGP